MVSDIIFLISLPFKIDYRSVWYTGQHFSLIHAIMRLIAQKTYHSNERLTGTWRFGYVGCLINNSATNVNLLGSIPYEFRTYIELYRWNCRRRTVLYGKNVGWEFINLMKVSIFQLTILSIDRSITVLPSSNSKIIQKLKTKRREAKFSIIVIWCNNKTFFKLYLDLFCYMAFCVCPELSIHIGNEVG